MRTLLGLTTVTVILLLTGCSTSITGKPSYGGPGMPATSSDSPPSSSQSSPGSSSPGSSSSASANASSSASAEPATGYGPTAQWIDATALTEVAGFASPSGGIICGMVAEGVVCSLMVESGIPNTPAPNTVCSPDSLQIINSVTLDPTGPGYACLNDPPAWPVDEAWAPGFAQPIQLSGATVQALPYGKGLVLGQFACSMFEDGVHCYNAAGKGFNLKKAGATFY